MGHVRRGIRMLKAAAVSCGSPRPGESLRKHCVELLQAEGMEPAIHKGAIRVLVLLAEPRVCDLCEALAVRGGNAVRGFAALAPSLLPMLVDGQDVQVRVVALAILTSVGADLGALYERLRAAETGFLF